MFQIKDGIITLNKSRKLTPKQIMTLKNCTSDSERNRYIMSLIGMTKQRVYVPRLKNGFTDQLAEKHGGSILRLMQKLQDLSHDHVPSEKDLGEWIGVEIECFIPGSRNSCGECDACCDGDDCTNTDESGHGDLKKALKKAGITRAQVKYDGSLHCDDGEGVEVTILFNSKHGYEPLTKLCKALNDFGCYVNKTCGLHVHMDARHLTPSKVTKIGASLGHALPVLKWLIPESRHSNSYCKLGVSTIRGDRYSAINLTAFRKYKTIEVRLHQGSINARKIKNWIDLLKLIGAAKLTQPLVTFQDLIDVGLSDELTAYCEARITELNPEAWPKLMPAESSQWPRPVVNEVINATNARLDAFERDERAGA